MFQVRSLRLIPVLVAALCQPPAAHAFSAAGHQLSADLAAPLLNPHAAAQVERLLGVPLRTASTWADCVRQVRVGPNGLTDEPTPRVTQSCAAFDNPAAIARMADHVRRHPCDPAHVPAACHLNHHYADISIAHERYDRAFTGSNDHDIVSALNATIAVLRGHPAPAPFSFRDDTHALLLLVHLVGDVHQPLHVGAVYLDDAGEPFDPDANPHSSGVGHTQGGNLLDIGAHTLHAEWDAIPAHLAAPALRLTLVSAARQVAMTPGDPATWPAVWASETLGVARSVFAGLSFHPDPVRPGHWLVQFADRAAYERRKEAIQTLQLTRAGARLAQVLNAVWP